MLVIYDGYTGLQKIAPVAARLTQCQRGLGGDSGIATSIVSTGFFACRVWTVFESGCIWVQRGPTSRCQIDALPARAGERVRDPDRKRRHRVGVW